METLETVDNQVSELNLSQESGSIDEGGFILANPASIIFVDEELLTEIKGIPNKLAFKIGEVADMLGIKQYVLRFWETEFEELRPRKSKTNQRAYTKKDVEMVFFIRKLLYRDRFSIEGARSALKTLRKEVRKEKNMQGAIEKVSKVRADLTAIITDINRIKKLFN